MFSSLSSRLLALRFTLQSSCTGHSSCRCEVAADWTLEVLATVQLWKSARVIDNTLAIHTSSKSFGTWGRRLLWSEHHCASKPPCTLGSGNLIPLSELLSLSLQLPNRSWGAANGLRVSLWEFLDVTASIVLSNGDKTPRARVLADKTVLLEQLRYRQLLSNTDNGTALWFKSRPVPALYFVSLFVLSKF
jgi:hypothetical protein